MVSFCFHIFNVRSIYITDFLGARGRETIYSSFVIRAESRWPYTGDACAIVFSCSMLAFRLDDTIARVFHRTTVPRCQFYSFGSYDLSGHVVSAGYRRNGIWHGPARALISELIGRVTQIYRRPFPSNRFLRPFDSVITRVPALLFVIAVHGAHQKTNRRLVIENATYTGNPSVVYGSGEPITRAFVREYRDFVDNFKFICKKMLYCLYLLRTENTVSSSGFGKQNSTTDTYCSVPQANTSSPGQMQISKKRQRHGAATEDRRPRFLSVCKRNRTPFYVTKIYSLASKCLITYYITSEFPSSATSATV